MAPEPFIIPDIKDQLGWRLSEQDKQDLRILMADRREKVMVNILRTAIHREAEEVRRRWVRDAKRFTVKEVPDA